MTHHSELDKLKLRVSTLEATIANLNASLRVLESDFRFYKSNSSMSDYQKEFLTAITLAPINSRSFIDLLRRFTMHYTGNSDFRNLIDEKLGEIEFHSTILNKLS